MLKFWIVASIVLIVLELIVPGMVLVFLGAGALLVALLIWLGLIQTWVASVTTWFIASMVLLLVMRRFFQKYLTGDEEKQSTDEDVDAYGEVVDVVEDIGPNNEGRIRFRGTTWQAACYDQTLLAGTKAQIVFRENLIWIVEPADELDAMQGTSNKGEDLC